jgi:hypothetical protein
MRMANTAIAAADVRTRSWFVASRRSGAIPVSTNTIPPTRTMATKFVRNSRAVPRASSHARAWAVIPTTDSGGTSAMATATPGSDDDRSRRDIA